MKLGPLLGAGKVAEVFEAGDDVIKLYRAGVGPEQARHEAGILHALRDTALVVPRSLGVMQAEGRWGLLMTRMRGRPLGEAMIAGADFSGLVETLAELHRQVHGQRVAGLPSLRHRLVDRIGRVSLLNGAERARLLDRLTALPDGDALCHGDFHPFNIVADGRELGIIDWLDATSGPAAADVGRTYLLVLHNLPSLAEPYLAARLRGATFDRRGVEAWLPVLAGARLAENVPEETDRLLDLVRAA